MIRQSDSPSRSKRAALAALGALVVGGLVAFAGSMRAPSAAMAAPPPARKAEDSHLDKTPPREIVGLVLEKSGWSYNCMECHALFPAKWHYARPMRQHADIKLEHGNNRFCLNCHHPTNRNVFVDYDGSEIPEPKVDLLCGKCHGTIHRDWEAGVHGRHNGHWNAKMGGESRLTCIQCHDPHSPAFKPMHPLEPLHYPPRAYNTKKTDPHASGEAHD
jgi:uncharacterized CHY-type Zn-finger protein